MDEVPTPDDLHGAGAVVRSLAYLTGVAGVVAGALVFREGDTVLAVVAWILTFAAGAVLMVVSVLVRAVAGLLARINRIESDLSVLVADRSRREDVRPPRDRLS